MTDKEREQEIRYYLQGEFSKGECWDNFLLRKLDEERAKVAFFNHTFQPYIGMARQALASGKLAETMQHLDKLNELWNISHKVPTP
jgi:hypothetical protein